MLSIKDATVKGALREAAAYLAGQWAAQPQSDAAVRQDADPRLDAEVLLAHVLGVERLRLFVEPDKPVPAPELAEFQRMIGARGTGRPVAYLTGQKEFMSMKFRVGPGVLIPRPETELLVEEALRLNPSVVIDVGTGSGAIAVSLARFLPEARVCATDISAEALDYARQNASDHGVAGKITFLQGNLLKPLPKLLQAHCITANLPYIPAGDLDNLPVDVRKYEPHTALTGGPDGLDHYRALIPQAMEFLAPGGVLLMEIGPGQGAALTNELSKYNAFTCAGVKCDYAGLERIVRAELRGDHNG